MAVLRFFLFLFILLTTVVCDTEFGISRHSIIKRASSKVKCEGGVINLCSGTITEAKPSTKSIQDEADDGDHPQLKAAYDKLSGEYEKRYQTVLANGRKLGLKDDETAAVFIYTMGSDAFYGDFNTNMREGQDKYPVFHHWLQSAVNKNSTNVPKVYRGYSRYANILTCTKIHMPSYTSASFEFNVAQNFSAPGCTIMTLNNARGIPVNQLSAFPDQFEFLIPPSDEYEVSNQHNNGTYHDMQLQWINTTKRDDGGTSVKTRPTTSVKPPHQLASSVHATSGFLVFVVITRAFFFSE